ncbi:MAG: hypothetical protein QOH63_927 [Acidobacteriota bacterium]|nr:hypothetical protein [Acidobacteriota bacterium]
MKGRRVHAVVRRAANRVGRAAVLLSDGCVVMGSALGLDAITFYAVAVDNVAMSTESEGELLE